MTPRGSLGKGATRLRHDGDPAAHKGVKRGTVRRIVPYATRRRGPLILLFVLTVVNALIMVGTPLLLKVIIDDGIVPRRIDMVVWLCVAVAGLALLSAAATYVAAWCSGRIGEGLVYDLRTTVFTHVQKQPLAFFTRAQTGALVSRLNSDVNGARQALTILLTQSVSTVLTLLLVLGAMFYLSWQIAMSGSTWPVPCSPSSTAARRTSPACSPARRAGSATSSPYG